MDFGLWITVPPVSCEGLVEIGIVWGLPKRWFKWVKNQIMYEGNLTFMFFFGFPDLRCCCFLHSFSKVPFPTEPWKSWEEEVDVVGEKMGKVGWNQKTWMEPENNMEIKTEPPNNYWLSCI